MYKPKEFEIFHIHTNRCKHASDEEDFRYVEAAIRLGADRVVFTDHAPFPDNPFRNRMDMEQLPEYIGSMSRLKKEYASQIEVMAGLEVEYLPSYLSYYQELFAMNELDLLMIGQHFYENKDGSWSFSDADKSQEYIGLCNAIVQGIETGLFDVVAHPDRSFRRCKNWTQDIMHASYDVIMAASKHKVYLEKNYTSMRHKNHYWEDFWVRSSMANCLTGYDAHSVAEMEEIWNKNHMMIPQEMLDRLLGK